MRQNTVLLSGTTHSFLPLPQNGYKNMPPILVENNSWSLFLSYDLKVSPDFNQSNFNVFNPNSLFPGFQSLGPLPRGWISPSSLIFRFITVSTSVSEYMDVSEPCPPWTHACCHLWVKLWSVIWAHFLSVPGQGLYPSKSASGFAKIFFIIILPLYHPWTLVFIITTWKYYLLKKKFENFVCDLSTKENLNKWTFV